MKKNKKQPSDLERLLEFVSLTHRFQNVKRMVRKTGELAWENDAEHSYQMIVVCLYLIDSMKLTHLNCQKVIMYALVHDWPEVYKEFDCCAFTDRTEVLKNKPEEERKAILRLKRDLPEFKIFHDALEEYEKRTDAEARFVYSIDKILPFYNIVLDKGLTWRQFNTKLDEILQEKEAKARVCPIGSKLFDQIIEHLRGAHGELYFHTPIPDDKRVPMPVGRLDHLRGDQLSNIIPFSQPNAKVSA